MINVAVIGVGSMGRNHARVYSELSEANLCAVVDTDAKKASEIAELHGVPGFVDYREMLAKLRPSAVSIAVPTAMHAEVALASLDEGAHILIEKPISATLEEGKKIIQKARETNKQLMVGHVVRFNPAIKQLKELLDANELGRIFQIVCRRVGPFPSRIRDVSVVVDLATHDLDLMRYLTGLDPIRIYAETEHRINTDKEDLVLGLLRFPGGIVGAIEINWLTPTKVREIHVLGERGLYRVDDLTQDLYFYENAHEMDNIWQALQALRGVSEGSMTRFALKRVEPLKAELKAFLSSIQNDTVAPVNGEDGLSALHLALSMVESGRTHQIIEMMRY